MESDKLVAGAETLRGCGEADFADVETVVDAETCDEKRLRRGRDLRHVMLLCSRCVILVERLTPRERFW